MVLISGLPAVHNAIRYLIPPLTIRIHYILWDLYMSYEDLYMSYEEPFRRYRGCYITILTTDTSAEHRE